MSNDGQTLTVTQAACNDVPGEASTVGVVSRSPQPVSRPD